MNRVGVACVGRELEVALECSTGGALVTLAFIDQAEAAIRRRIAAVGAYRVLENGDAPLLAFRGETRVFLRRTNPWRSLGAVESAPSACACVSGPPSRWALAFAVSVSTSAVVMGGAGGGSVGVWRPESSVAATSAGMVVASSWAVASLVSSSTARPAMQSKAVATPAPSHLETIADRWPACHPRVDVVRVPDVRIFRRGRRRCSTPWRRFGRSLGVDRQVVTGALASVGLPRLISLGSVNTRRSTDS